MLHKISAAVRADREPVQTLTQWMEEVATSGFISQYCFTELLNGLFYVKMVKN